MYYANGYENKICYTKDTKKKQKEVDPMTF